MTYQSGEPSYVPPQDPWSGEQGTVSAPTEPLPAPTRDPGQFAPGVASPADWSPSTGSDRDLVTLSPSQMSSAPRRRTGLYILVFLLVAAIGGAVGFASWWVTGHYAEQIGIGSADPSETTTSSEPTASPTLSGQRYHPDLVEVGSCLTNRGAEGRPEMWVVPCDEPDTYRVLKVLAGAEIPEGMDEKFREEATAQALCSDVAWNAWFGWDSDVDALDHFYCMRSNPA
jgi:hypothetical protein